MAGGLTEKQRAFAVAYVQTGNAAEAYRTAYDVAENARDSWLYVEAHQLLDHPKVRPYIDLLQQEAKERNQFTVMQAAAELEEARAMAMMEKQASAAISAVAAKIKLFGVDKPTRFEHTGKDGAPIKTEETGQAATKLAAYIQTIAERSRETGAPE
jgi:phage terminase small subunit